METPEQFLQDSDLLGIDPAKIARTPCSGDEAHQLRWENQVMSGKLRKFAAGRAAAQQYIKDLQEQIRKLGKDLEVKEEENKELRKMVEEYKELHEMVEQFCNKEGGRGKDKGIMLEQVNQDNASSDETDFDPEAPPDAGANDSIVLPSGTLVAKETRPVMEAEKEGEQMNLFDFLEPSSCNSVASGTETVSGPCTSSVNTEMRPGLVVAETIAIPEAGQGNNMTSADGVPMPSHILVISGNPVKYKCTVCNRLPVPYDMEVFIGLHKDCDNDLYRVTPRRTPGSKKDEGPASIMKGGDRLYAISKLRRHQSSHLRQKKSTPFKCSLCGACVSRKPDLTRHIKNVHKKSTDEAKELSKPSKGNVSSIPVMEAEKAAASEGSDKNQRTTASLSVPKHVIKNGNAST